MDYFDSFLPNNFDQNKLQPLQVLRPSPPVIELWVRNFLFIFQTKPRRHSSGGRNKSPRPEPLSLNRPSPHSPPAASRSPVFPCTSPNDLRKSPKSPKFPQTLPDKSPRTVPTRIITGGQSVAPHVAFRPVRDDNNTAFDVIKSDVTSRPQQQQPPHNQYQQYGGGEVLPVPHIRKHYLFIRFMTVICSFFQYM